MARAKYGSIRPEARGVACSTCSMDEWKWSKPQETWKCRPCSLKAAAKNRAKIPAPLRLYRQAKARSKKNGTEFTITVIDVQRVWPRDERCPVLGLELKWQGGHNSPSLDRIDSSRGYTPDNIAVISHRANTIKWDATADEVANVARWMQEQTGTTRDKTNT